MVPIIEATSLTKKFRQSCVINDVSVQIYPGEIVGFIGPNGAGKTTLLRILSGLVIPNKGTIAYEGQTKGKVFHLAKKKIGATINYPSLYPNMSAYDNLKAYALGRDISVDENAIQTALESVGLENNKKHAKNYSMGMKQRLSLAMALFGGCEVIFLDEPFNGLDPIGLKQIASQIRGVNREKHVAFVVASHNLSELEELCDRFLFLEKGKIVQTLSKEQLKKKEQRIVSFVSLDTKNCLALLCQEGWAFKQEGDRYLIFSDDDPLSIVECLRQNGITMTDLSITKESLMHLYSEGRIGNE